MVDVVCVCPCVCIILAVTGRVSYTEDLWSGHVCVRTCNSRKNARRNSIFTTNNDTADIQFFAILDGSKCIVRSF